jgi:hypothetical protein
MIKKRTVICDGCGKERSIYSNNPPKYCCSCSAKNRFGTLGVDKWIKKCSKCGEDRVFTWRKTYSKSGELCISCSQIKNTEHYNREYQRYRGKVWSETNRQPLHLLENFDKRGKSGINDAYQIDHILSVKYGFENKIDPKVIGNIKNLQMLPWKENRYKW